MSYLRFYLGSYILWLFFHITATQYLTPRCILLGTTCSSFLYISISYYTYTKIMIITVNYIFVL